jgi:acylphosphatase
MREWMWEGPDAAQVTQLDTASGEDEPTPPGFEVRPTV